MKENKQENIKVRITPKEKERIVEYCESHNITISEFIRMEVSRIFSTNSQEEEKWNGYSSKPKDD